MTAPALVAATSIHRAHLAAPPAARQPFRAGPNLTLAVLAATNSYHLPKMHLPVAKEGL
jgi:hypothetical protein